MSERLAMTTGQTGHMNGFYEVRSVHTDKSVAYYSVIVDWFRKKVFCTCAWSSIYGFNPDTGEMKKYCKHIMFAAGKILERPTILGPGEKSDWEVMQGWILEVENGRVGKESGREQDSAAAMEDNFRSEPHRKDSLA